MRYAKHERSSDKVRMQAFRTPEQLFKVAGGALVALVNRVHSCGLRRRVRHE